MLSEGLKCYFRDPIFQNLPGVHAPSLPRRRSYRFVTQSFLSHERVTNPQERLGERLACPRTLAPSALVITPLHP